MSLRVTFLACCMVFILDCDFSTLSAGNRASDNMVSSSMPKKGRQVAGPQVFSGARGTPKAGEGL